MAIQCAFKLKVKSFYIFYINTKLAIVCIVGSLQNYCSFMTNEVYSICG